MKALGKAIQQKVGKALSTPARAYHGMKAKKAWEKTDSLKKAREEVGGIEWMREMKRESMGPAPTRSNSFKHGTTSVPYRNDRQKNGY